MGALQTAVEEEPVFVALNGAGLLVNATLTALAVFGVVDIDTAGIAIRATAIQGFVNAVAAVIRPLVYKPSSVVVSTVPGDGKDG